MKTKEAILQLVRKKGAVRTSEMVKRLGISRQTVAQHFRELIAAKQLLKVRSTRNAYYISYHPKRAQTPKQAKGFSSRYPLKGLEEDRVFREIELRMALKRQLSPAAYRAVSYAFTEMLNNAIEHSKGSAVAVTLRCERGTCEFQVEDKGIGAFESIRRKFRFSDHFEAVAHLTKGKQTTDPQHHSGQGIFFTSKIADRFTLESARLCYAVDNAIKDVLLEDIKPLKGTRVTFRLKRRSRKDLKALFDEYSGSNYEFDKTRITVHLSGRGEESISRSQARRVLFGLEKFKRVVLDFKKVKGIGQGFADEIFRVFQSAHPAIKIEAIHMSPSVTFMVRRALAER